MKYVIIIPTVVRRTLEHSGKNAVAGRPIARHGCHRGGGLRRRSRQHATQFRPASEVANIGVFGLRPERIFTGRANDRSRPRRASTRGIPTTRPSLNCGHIEDQIDGRLHRPFTINTRTPPSMLKLLNERLFGGEFISGRHG